MIYFFLFLFIAIVLLIQFLYFRHYLTEYATKGVASRKIKEEVEEIIRELNQATERNILLVENSLENLRENLALIDKREKQFEQKKERAERAFGAYQQIKEQISIPRKSAKETKKSETLSEETDSSKNMKDEIISLYKKGINPTLIAQNLEIDLGEVELVISIHSL